MNRIEMDYLGCKIRFNLEHKVCMIRRGSDNSEAIVVEALREYCRNNKIDCRYVNADMLNITGDSIDEYGKVDRTKLIKDICNGGKVIILDNGDLYVSGGELSAISNDSNLVIVVMQYTGLVTYTVKAGIYKVNVDETNRIIDISRWM